MFEVLSSTVELSTLGFLVRTILVGILIFILSKFLPRRSGGQFAGYDFTFFWMMGGLAAAPLFEAKIGFRDTLVAIITIYILHYLISNIALKNRFFAKLLFGEPIILINKGKVLKAGLKKALVPLELLFSELRVHGIADLAQVEYAIMETNGHISVVTKHSHTPITPININLEVPKDYLPELVINDGVINKGNLLELGFSEDWLVSTITKRGLSVKDIFVCTLDKTGKLTYQKFI